MLLARCLRQIVHDLYEGEETAALIEAAFPGACTLSAASGKPARVDRRKLGPLVVGDKAKMARLNAIVHPLVARERTALVRVCEDKGSALAVIDVPLLFETKGESEVDATLVVTCSPGEQRRSVTIHSLPRSLKQVSQRSSFFPPQTSLLALAPCARVVG